jgi:sugar phosphate isomerase/epimerase
VTTLTASTLGAPDDDLDRVLSWLQKAGVPGLELRVAPGQIAHSGMTPSACADVRARIADAGIELTGLASYVKLCSDASDGLVVGELSDVLTLASGLGAPVVRVFPGAPVRSAPNGTRPELLEPESDVTARAVRRLDAVAHLSEDLGVHAALETHDSHPRAADIVPILDQVSGPVGAIWDLMHPWRTGEPLERTLRLLSPWLAGGRGCVHVKDANLPADATPLPIGDGTLPVDEFAQLLVDERYDGVVCLEWEKAWYPAAQELPTALDSAVRWFDRHWRPQR